MFQGGWCPIIYGVINLAVTELSIDPSLWARPIRGTNWFLSSSTIKSLIGIICVETKKKLILSFLGWITVCIISTHHSKIRSTSSKPRVLEYLVPMKKHWVNPNCQNSEPTKRTVSISAKVLCVWGGKNLLIFSWFVTKKKSQWKTLKFSEYVQNISRSKSFGKFVLISSDSKKKEN